MSRKILGKIPLLFGLAFLLVAGIFLSWRLVPAKGMEKALIIPAGILPASSSEHPISIQQDLEIKATYPLKIRAGEKDKLTLEVIPHTDLYEEGSSEGSQTTLAAELTMLNMIQAPQGMVNSVYDPQQPREFSWELSAQEAGLRQGSLWVSLNSLQGDGTRLEVPLAAWDIEIEVMRLWDMNSPTVTWLAMLLLLAWGGMMVLGVKLEHDLKLSD